MSAKSEKELITEQVAAKSPRRGGGTAMRGGLTAAFRAGASIKWQLQAPPADLPQQPTRDDLRLNLCGPLEDIEDARIA
jgi:hypothetical protein